MKRISIIIFTLTILLACEQSEKKKQQKKAETIEEKLINASKSIESSPTASAYQKRFQLYYTLEEYALAFDDIVKAIKLDSTKAVYHYNMATMFRRLPDIEKSIKSAKKANELGLKDVNNYVLLGENYFILKQYQEAINVLNQGMRLDQFNDKIYFYKGMIYKESNDYENAMSSFQTVLELNPDYADAYNQLVILSLGKKEYEVAQIYIESGLRFNPEDPFLWFNQGVSLQKQNLLDSCILPYKRSFRLDSTLTLAAFNLGVVYYQLRRHEESIEKLNRVVELNPKNSNALYINALNYRKMNKLDETKDLLKQSLTIDPENSEALELYNKLK